VGVPPLRQLAVINLQDNGLDARSIKFGIGTVSRKHIIGENGWERWDDEANARAIGAAVKLCAQRIQDDVRTAAGDDGLGGLFSSSTARRCRR
jgi:hypothetical protein